MENKNLTSNTFALPSYLNNTTFYDYLKSKNLSLWNKIRLKDFEEADRVYFTGSILEAFNMGMLYKQWEHETVKEKSAKRKLRLNFDSETQLYFFKDYLKTNNKLLSLETIETENPKQLEFYLDSTKSFELGRIYENWKTKYTETPIKYAGGINDVLRECIFIRSVDDAEALEKVILENKSRVKHKEELPNGCIKYTLFLFISQIHRIGYLEAKEKFSCKPSTEKLEKFAKIYKFVKGYEEPDITKIISAFMYLYNSGLI